MPTKTSKQAKSPPKPKAPADGTAAVEAYLAALEHPMKAQVVALRKQILAVDPRIVEQVKWNAPSFRTAKDYLVTFNLRDPSLLLVFHNPLIPKVKSDLLEGDWKDRRLLRLADAKDAKAKTPEVRRIVAALVKEMDA